MVWEATLIRISSESSKFLTAQASLGVGGFVDANSVDVVFVGTFLHGGEAVAGVSTRLSFC